jgi:phosphohistidine phosphatase
VVWIHLLRHGIAVDRDDPACPADPERYLTDKGKVRTRAAAKGLAAVGIAPDLVLVSPYVRAQQTADIAVEELGAAGARRETVDALTPMGDPARAIEAVRASGGREVLCVGHAPNLDLVAARLLGCDTAVTHLKKAGVASLLCQSYSYGGGVLFAVYPASALRQLGGG